MSRLIQNLRTSKFVQRLQTKYPAVYKIAFKWGMTCLRILELPRYYSALAFGKPYFGAIHFSMQSWSERRPYMRQAIQLKVKTAMPTEPLRILEIGSWAGHSTLLWGNEVKGRGLVYCIDPWRPVTRNDHQGINAATEMMNTAARKDKIFPLFWHNIKSSGLEKTVIPLRGTSRELLPLLGGTPFDLIFVDGSHAYSDFHQDLNQAGPLVKEGGILCGDDLELQSDQVDCNEMEAQCEKDFVLDSKTGQAFHPGVTLGVHRYFNRRITSYYGFWAVQKIAGQWHDLELSS